MIAHHPRVRLDPQRNLCSWMLHRHLNRLYWKCTRRKWKEGAVERPRLGILEAGQSWSYEASKNAVVVSRLQGAAFPLDILPASPLQFRFNSTCNSTGRMRDYSDYVYPVFLMNREELCHHKCRKEKQAFSFVIYCKYHLSADLSSFYTTSFQTSV